MMMALFGIGLWGWAYQVHSPEAYDPILPALILLFAVRDIVEGRF